MSSITVKDLIAILYNYPDDYEVIMDWSWKEHNSEGDVKEKHSIAMINAVYRDDDHKEVRLHN